jgi:hypothetical protein
MRLANALCQFVEHAARHAQREAPAMDRVIIDSSSSNR